jgi:hypothetical protein
VLVVCAGMFLRCLRKMRIKGDRCSTGERKRDSLGLESISVTLLEYHTMISVFITIHRCGTVPHASS